MGQPAPGVRAGDWVLRGPVNFAPFLTCILANVCHWSKERLGRLAKGRDVPAILSAVTEDRMKFLVENLETV